MFTSHARFVNVHSNNRLVIVVKYLFEINQSHWLLYRQLIDWIDTSKQIWLSQNPIKLVKMAKVEIEEFTIFWLT